VPFFRVPILGEIILEAETHEEAQELALEEKQHAEYVVGQAELIKE
jgi:hypothetical protein